MTRLALLLPLALAACAADISGVYYDTPAAQSATLRFVGGYSMHAPTPGSARQLVHQRLEALPDGSTLTLGANGCLYLTDEAAIAIVQRKAFRVVDTPISGCDGKVILPPPFKRVQP